MSTSTLIGASPSGPAAGDGAGGAPSSAVCAAAAGAVALDDVYARGAAERLMEQSWRARFASGPAHELRVETLAAGLFLLCALPLAAGPLAAPGFPWGLALLLLALFVPTSDLIRFPVGAGYVVPTYLMLVPMLLLLPPAVVPLLVAAGLLAGTLCRVALGQAPARRCVSAIPDAWYSLGPALVLMAAGTGHGPVVLALVYVAAFIAGCAVDLLSATVREWAIQGVASKIQLRVHAQVWVVDACIAPLGLLIALAMRRDPAVGLLILPLNVVLLMVARDRTRRIEQAQRRLEIVAHQRSRLQSAVQRFGDALAAKLDLDALAEIVAQGSVEALDAEHGLFMLRGDVANRTEVAPSYLSSLALGEAAHAAMRGGQPARVHSDGIWALALPLALSAESAQATGALSVGRRDRPFGEDEQALMQGLLDRACKAALDILLHSTLREHAFTDALTKLGNRRRLEADVAQQIPVAGELPLTVVLFDLDGFKGYNDTFGHAAGDGLLARLGGALAEAAAGLGGSAYRLGGDEFCAVVAVADAGREEAIASLAEALHESGDAYTVATSYGCARIPVDAATLGEALQLADERMYSRKRARSSAAAQQARDVLLDLLRAKLPGTWEHCAGVAQLSRRVGRRMGVHGGALEELERAAELCNVGQVAVPDAILDKAGPLSEDEWMLIREHTVRGAEILGRAPALESIAGVVRATHERWDGSGYPDRLCGEEIPLAARIIAVCDAYQAMLDGRRYRPARSRDAAARELALGTGSQFDPGVVAALLREVQPEAVAAPPAVIAELDADLAA